MIDPASGKVRRTTVPGENPSGTVVFGAEERLLFVPTWSGAPVRVYDESLTELATWTGWEASHTITVNDRLVGLAHGLVQQAAVDGSDIHRFAELGDGLPGAITAVGDPTGTDATDSRPASRPAAPGDADSSGRTVIIALIAAALLAAGVAAIWSHSRQR
jgi:hypothetical protein